MGIKVLIVDDEPIFREPIAELLRENGFIVDEESSAQGAIKRFKKQKFDLLLTDMVMSGMNGVQLIKEFHKAFPNTEAIVMSAFGTEATKNKLDSIGAFGYIDKPVKLENLLKMVHGAKKSNRLIRLGLEKKEPEVSFNREQILIADDDPTIRSLVTEILSRKGHRVTSVPNGSDAFERILVNDYDCVIMDINMPKMSGIEAVKLIREQDQFVYILLISGEAESDEIKEALKNGADKFLPKPFNRADLLGTIEKIDFSKIKEKKAKAIEKEDRRIQKCIPWNQRLFYPLTTKKFRKKVLEFFLLIVAGMIIGAISAFMEFDLKPAEDPYLDRTDKLIDAIKKDWGR